MASAPINQMRWVRLIVEAMTSDNSFIKEAINDNQYLNGTKVIRPIAGGIPQVVKNNAVFPLPATKRVDYTSEYDVDKYSQPTIMLESGEQDTLSYPKMQSLVDGIYTNIEAETHQDILYKWTPDVGTAPNNIVLTSGNTIAADISLSMTGNRKAISREDIQALRLKMNQENIPSTGRILVIPAYMENDIFSIPDFISVEKIVVANMRNGYIGRVLGFDVYTRDRVAIVDGTLAKKDIRPSMLASGATTIAATDSHAAICFHKQFVAYAHGTATNGGINVTINPRVADYDGSDLMSAWVRSGAAPVHPNFKGVYMLVQA